MNADKPDLHTTRAMEIFRVKRHEVTPSMRDYAKRQNYRDWYTVRESIDEALNRIWSKK